MHERDEKERQVIEISCNCEGCCGIPSSDGSSKNFQKYVSENNWVSTHLKTVIGPLPVVSTRLTWRDKLGMVAVRLGIKRMSYAIRPGLYAVGNPDNSSYIFVSANYKLSFDLLRKHLDGLNA